MNTTETIENAVSESYDYQGLTVWDRPSEKAANTEAKFPMTQEQLNAQAEFGKRLHALLEEGINSGAAGAFITPSENGKTLLIAATIPVPALTLNAEGGEQITTNKWALNLNVAVPRETKTASAPAAEPRPAMSLADLRKVIAQKRQSK